MEDEFVPTNTLATADYFDILKFDAVEDPLINVNNFTDVDFEEHSCFADAVAFVTECDDMAVNAKIKFYHSLQESTSEVAILEAFSDYFSFARDIVTKFIKFLQSMLDKFLASMNKLISGDTYLKKNIDKIKNFKDSDAFTFSGYEFTFDPGIPSADAIAHFDAGLFSELKNPNGSGVLDVQDVQDAVNSIDMEKACDKFRGDVLNTTPINAGSYQTRLFTVYRGGYSDTKEITANAAYIKGVAQQYKDFSKTKQELQNNLSNIRTAYNNVIDKIKKITSTNGNMNVNAFLNNLPSGMGIKGIDSKYIDNNGMTMSGDILNAINVYTRAKVNQIQEFTNIHVLAFSSKLDAVNAEYKQDRNVLYTALNASIKPFGEAK